MYSEKWEDPEIGVRGIRQNSVVFELPKASRS